ncbi:hypothetical protein [Ancylothrix sp. D3o]|nr:hypothetical protein [Ancylothrix sp. D3o]
MRRHERVPPALGVLSAPEDSPAPLHPRTLTNSPAPLHPKEQGS